MAIGSGGNKGQIKTDIEIPGQVVILFLNVFEPDVVVRGDASNTRQTVRVIPSTLSSLDSNQATPDGRVQPRWG